ncbi:hypothetical protein CROQUDRAFT_43492 [Cronartium quercuum f. sp. fusiforme G11]|uniref:Glucose-methanol-choline oxidoreductase N-terminal domain-containing protein n=1 Tax=Cronartium quercuum f. sp. fusiforme G11 TaxID=708437 RepID=A0A9P6NP61_9BASI|nr:hypothetical protein CROQUDRAFT_43492 [Cronartium quercuum f. sp. fusiforme G11]
MNLLSSKWPFCFYSSTICSIFLSVSTYFDDPCSKEVYDYIIVGGGTAGLVVASRLSENPETTVLVLEAGESGHQNLGIQIPGFMGTTFHTSVDWNYSTVTLEHAGNRSLVYPRGKVLGGSSALNFMVSTKASLHDYHALEKLGNPGWGWDEFDRASKKSEKVLRPKTASNFTFVPRYHGHHGLVKTSFPKYFPSTFSRYFPAARELSHESVPEDTFGGDLKGPYNFPSTINDNAERVTSATAYYYPFASRPNLVVRLKSEVDRLLTSKSRDGKVIVKAVRYESQSSMRQSLARKEVILSAGSIGSPAILERSGMGDPAVLKQLKIPVLNNLTGVGANFVDHPLFWGVYQLRPGIISADEIVSNTTFKAEQLKLYQNHREGILTHAEEILEGLNYLYNHSSSDSSHLTQPMLKVVEDQMLKGTPIEFILVNQRSVDMSPTPNASYISIVSALQYPLSRGTTHISSRDPTKDPLINPGYFRHPFDLWLLAKATKHARTIMENSLWKDVISGEHFPGPSVKSDEEWRNYVMKNSQTIYHPIGTAAMLPREYNGVVDPELRVYGTQKLRIIDASIIPIHLAMHPQMTIYAIAELGVEKILNSSKFGN